jgi:hypothetical protein
MAQGEVMDENEWLAFQRFYRRRKIKSKSDHFNVNG